MKVKIPRAPSVGEETLALHLKTDGILFSREWKFHPTRKWKFDFVVGKNIAIEVEGGSWSGGSHNRGKRFEDDCEKYNTAVLFGWRVFRFTTNMVKSGIAIDVIHRALQVTEE